MPTIHSGAAGVAPRTTADGRWGAPIEAMITVLELIASEQPRCLDFQIHVLCNSTMSFAAQEIATELGVPPERLGKEIARACMDLDRLEKHTRTWRDPAKVLRSPNLGALRYLCRARLNRVEKINRRRRLERIERRVEAAYELARTRAWVDAFIGQSDVR